MPEKSLAKRRKSAESGRKTFLKVFEKKLANISSACRAANIDRNTYYRWRRSNAKFARACQNIEDSLLDISESKLMAAVKKGEAWAICFHLKCKGKERGYVERVERTGKDGEPMKIETQISGDKRAERAIALLIEEADEEIENGQRKAAEPDSVLGWKKKEGRS